MWEPGAYIGTGLQCPLCPGARIVEAQAYPLGSRRAGFSPNTDASCLLVVLGRSLRLTSCLKEPPSKTHAGTGRSCHCSLVVTGLAAHPAPKHRHSANVPGTELSSVETPRGRPPLCRVPYFQAVPYLIPLSSSTIQHIPGLWELFCGVHTWWID